MKKFLSPAKNIFLQNARCSMPCIHVFARIQKNTQTKRTFCTTLTTRCTPNVDLPFKLEKQGGEFTGVVVGHLDNAKTKNAISRHFLRILEKCVDELKFDREARVLILKSNVDGVFCAGADLKERKGFSQDEVRAFTDTLRGLMNELSNLPMPVIAAIDGHALGGGLEMALACDIRICWLPETRLAIIPGAGGTQRLPRLVGIAKAKELIMTGKVLSGNEALELGIVNHVDEDPFGKALEIAKEILKRGPLAIRLAKIAINQGSQVELNSAMAIEQQCYAQTLPTKDRLEGLAAFAEKRDPIYKGE